MENVNILTQSDIALSLQDKFIIIDDATSDTLSYYELVMQEKKSIAEQEKIIEADASDYTKTYLEELF